MSLGHLPPRLSDAEALALGREPDIHEAAWAYLECASWSTSVSDEDGNTVHDSIDDTDAEWNLTAVAAAEKQIRDFLSEEVDEIIERWQIAPGQLGHDLWLTRNHHGAGFWDRGYGPDGDRLTQLCKPMGTDDAYIGDDGTIHLTSEE